MGTKTKAAGWIDGITTRQSRTCASCDSPWKETIRECLVAMLEDGRKAVTFAALHRWLIDPGNFDGEPYQMTLSSLLYHIREHERDLHSEIANRGQ